MLGHGCVDSVVDEHVGRPAAPCDITDSQQVNALDNFVPPPPKPAVEQGKDAYRLERKLHAAFKKFDKDGSGALDKDEIFQGLLSIGYKVSAADKARIVKRMDRDGDGVIDIQEFLGGITRDMMKAIKLADTLPGDAEQGKRRVVVEKEGGGYEMVEIKDHDIAVLREG